VTQPVTRPADTIAITGIEVFAHHGVFEHERREGQTFVVDLLLAVDTRPAAASDDLKDTVDYGSVVDRVVSETSRDPVDLIETLAQRLADAVLREPAVSWVQITLHKPHAPIDATFADVALTITRSR
jgi:dihydroneopterin aldolase